MSSNAEPLTVYHASYVIVETVNLDFCKKRNDFGRGFYLTTNEEQACRFVRTAVRKTGQAFTVGYVNQYRLEPLSNLIVKEFASADEQWLDCVCDNRRAELRKSQAAGWDNYDAICGKIANDDTMATITIYLAAGYGEVDSSEAKATAIRQLKPERLHDQICLKSALALERLSFVKAYEVPVNE